MIMASCGWLSRVSSFCSSAFLRHEFGHYYAARRLGGHMDALVIGPLGGLRSPRVPRDPQSELSNTGGRPRGHTWNLFLLPGNCRTDLRPNQQKTFSTFLNRRSTDSATGIRLDTLIRLTCWINWWLLILNAIPAFPFDGGSGHGRNAAGCQIERSNMTKPFPSWQRSRD